MKDKIVLITGGTGGIGKQTALALAKLDARVIVTGRNQASGEAAVAELKQLSGSLTIDLLLGNLTTQAGVRSLAAQFKQRYNRLDVLINNAGLAAIERRLTEDGIEANFAVNVVAPFLLIHLLWDSLQVGPSARVVNVTGGVHPTKLDLDNLQGERSFVGLTAYSHSKLAMMGVMYEFGQRRQASNVTINVCYPGQASTNMTQSVTPDMLPPLMRLIFPLFKWMTRPDGGKSAAKAARSSIYLASSADVEGVSGKYFNPKCKLTDWPAPVLDPAARRQLWATVEEVAQIISGERNEDTKNQRFYSAGN